MHLDQVIPKSNSKRTRINFSIKATNYDKKLIREGFSENELQEYCKTTHPSHKETAILSLDFTVGEALVDTKPPLVFIEYADSSCQQTDLITTNCMKNMWLVKVIAKDEGTGLSSFAFNNLDADCEDEVYIASNLDSNIKRRLISMDILTKCP